MDEKEVLYDSPIFTEYLYALNPGNRLILTEWHDNRWNKWQLLLCENYMMSNQRSTFIGSYSSLGFAENAIKALRSLLH